MGCTLSEASSVIGDLATAVGVAVAIWGVVQWRSVKRKERESEVATRALAALESTCEALSLWSVRLSVVASGEASLHDLLRANGAGKEAVDEGLPELRAALAVARVYLSSAQVEALEAAREIARDIEKEFNEFFESMGDEPAPRRLEAMRKSFEELTPVIDEVAQRGEKALGPVARLETAGPAARAWKAILQRVGTEQADASARRTTTR